MVKTESIRAFHISVSGVVQGVGFRPFVYRLASKYNLAGWVRNTSGSVEIEVEGKEAALHNFVGDLKFGAPPVAVITNITLQPLPARGFAGFEIKDSLAENNKYQLISPDIATCSECLSEILNPSDRRYYYSFTNCTNCGPRFTIIEDIPYDRPLTTMRHFKMCSDCQREYDDPLDRRFHAQPNACPKCGPSLRLVDGNGKDVLCSDIIHEAGKLLRKGKLLALKGLGGFQLACDATNTETVRLLRVRKRRPSKPFALMMTSPDEVKKYCLVSPEEEKLLTSPQSPIVLLRIKDGVSGISLEVAPKLLYLGVMLPYTPIHNLLLREVPFPLIMTSGNLSEEPIVRDNDEALQRLKGIADYFVLHDRDIYSTYDDSVTLVDNGEVRIIRRARGYAPFPVALPFKEKQVLACGSEEKNTFCLTRDNYAFVSQHIGDMENEETLEHYEDTVELYKKLFRIRPEIIAYDMHPEYLATKYALSFKSENNLELKFVPVQHHHAHIVSCMAENGITAPVIGVSFDGTGFGTDGAIWGGEFLVADYKGFQRVGHLEYVLMPGGALAIKKPYRMALGYIYGLLGKDVLLNKLPLNNMVGIKELDIIKRQIEKGINSPQTSSAGRLFDAVVAITGVRGVVDYDAQAAVELEMLATPEIEKREYEPYPFSIDAGECKIIRLGELISAVIRDVENGLQVSEISARFHKTVASIITKMCQSISNECGIKTIALSGGVFQNRLLSQLVINELKYRGFTVLSHHLVPCNDGGLSLGQAVIGNFAKDN